MFGLRKYKDALGKPNQGLHSIRAGISSPKEICGLLVCGYVYATLGNHGAAASLLIVLILTVIISFVGSIAVFDTIGTMLISAGLAKLLGTSFDRTFMALLLSAEALHVAFGVHKL